ncbi:WD-40 repeat-containing protein (plasmid) [Fischerella sp. NIES-4106]|nr:WD-40 repeat-containing protein [Fischerella sp. NIES-4106]
MNKQPKQKRKRGLILTPDGLQKLQSAKLACESNENFGTRYTLEDLSERIGINTATISKVLSREGGVDKRTLELFFQAFNIEFDKTCYTNSDPSQRQDWGEALCVSVFYGRTEEITTLEQLVLEEHCRLVAVLGMGGIGKTALSVKFAEKIKEHFEYVIWRSLREAPPVNAILANLIGFLSDGQETEAFLPETVGDKISRLIDYLRQQRCLLILDNMESILCSGRRAGTYREGYEGYGELLKRVGETAHQSCLMVTSREKPKDIVSLEGEALPVRSFVVRGLQSVDGEEIFKVKGISASELEFKKLIERYAGNVLALKVVATTIKDLFSGNVAEFLQQEAAVFGDINDLLEQQFERLPNLEIDIMYWLAINREPVSRSELQEDIVSSIPSKKLLEALESLARRSFIEKATPTVVEKNTPLFTLQPVVMEYVTNRLIDQVCEEIETGNIDLFRCHALMKATAKDYVMESQIRLIIKPLIEGLLTVFRNKTNLVNQLNQILTKQQEEFPLEPAYTAGNILNLLCQLEVDLSGYDFSNLSVWQADLRNVKLHDVNFQNANLAKSVFTETFGGVTSVAFSPDGKLLALGDTNGEIRLYQVSDEKQVLTCNGHTNWVTSLAFSPDSKTLASGSIDYMIKLWDVSNSKCLQTLQGHNNEVWSVVFSTDGQMLVSGSDDHTVKLWSLSTYECFKTFEGHTNWVCSVAFSMDGQTVFSGSDDQTIKLWDVSSGECLKTFRGHDDGIRSITVSPNGQILASGSEDQTIKLWDISSGECLKTFRGHSNEVYSVAFSPQGDLLASGSFDQTVRLWNVNTNECLKTFHGHSSWIFSVCFSPQSNLLASGSYDQTVRLWNINTNECLKTFKGYTQQVLSIVFSPDGHILASGSRDFLVRLWDINKDKTLQIFQGHHAGVRSVAFSPNGQMIASGSDDRTVKLWNVDMPQASQTFQGHRAAVWSIAFSPGGQMVASGSEDRTVKLWDVNTGHILQTFQGHQAAVWSVAFNPQGAILASGALDHTIKLWDVSIGVCKRTLKGHTHWAWSVTFSPDGKLLASASSDGTLRLWSVSTGECCKILYSSTGWLHFLAFSLDSQILASSSQDNTVKLWNVSTGECFKSLQGHTGRIWSVVFSPDNQTLASSSEDETIRLWNVITGECLKILKSEKLYERMNIMGVADLTTATVTTLKVLGAVDSI